MGKWKTLSAATIGAAMLLTAAMPASASEPLESAAAEAAATSAEKTAADAAREGDAVSIDAKIQKDEALALAKKLGSVPDSYTLQGIYFNAGQNSRSGFNRSPSWNVNFSKVEQNRFYGDISVTIDANTGRLLQYNLNENDPDKKPVFPPKADLQAAKRIALDFLNQYNADELANTRYNDTFEKNFKTPLNGVIQYHIQYDRTVNGIPFPQNSISVDVNGEGQVVGYSMNWDDGLSFEKAEGVIGLEEAKTKLASQMDLFLSYQFPYEMRGTDRKPLLAYMASIPSLDAKTGDAWNGSGSGTKPAPKDRTPLTKGPLGERPTAGKTLTKEEAVARITQVFQLPDNVKLEDASYSEQKDPNVDGLQANWNIRWSIPADDKESAEQEGGKKSLVLPYPDQIRATVDGNTGEIRNFSRNDIIIFNKTNSGMGSSGSAADGKKLSWDEAKTKALDLIRSVVPYYTSQLVLDNDPSEYDADSSLQEMPSFQFRFKRVIDGVEAGYEGIYVGVDRKTGEIISYSNNFSAYAYPEQKPQTISAEQAKKLMLDQYTVELQYAVQVNGGVGSPIPLQSLSAQKYKLMVAAGEIKPDEEVQVQTKLVYAAAPKAGWQLGDIYLDAVTGTWKQLRDGEPARLTKQEITDITGNPAEKELRMMAEYGALDVQDGKLNPEQTMTRGELIKMLVIAMNGGGPVYVAADRKASFHDVGGDSPYFAYVESAVDRQLIDRNVSAFQPDAKMSRQDMADLIVRALGYRQLAQVSGLFSLDVSDAADVTEKGAAAIVVALGIMEPLDGAFKPAAEVNRADAAVSFYRYLQKRSELQDRPYYVGW